MNNNALYVIRLETLLSLVSANKDIYDHSSFKTSDGKMCAAGIAIEHKDLFPGLNIKFDEFGYVSPEHGDEWVHDLLDDYFGPGSWHHIFDLYPHGYWKNITHADTVKNIKTHIKKLKPCKANTLKSLFSRLKLKILS